MKMRGSLELSLIFCPIKCNFCPVFVVYVALVLIFLRFCNITRFVCYILVCTKKSDPLRDRFRMAKVSY